MRVLTADDDRLVLESLKIILKSGGAEIAAEAASGEQAVELYGRCKPDVVVMDIRMSGMSGLEAACEILKKDASAKILFLTTFHDTEYIAEALDMGASGYILKQDYNQLLPALEAVMAGGSVLGGEVINAIPRLLKDNRRKDLSSYGIDQKQQAIIEGVAKGMSNKEIAESLYLSEGTVRNYLSVILNILGLRDRTQLAVFYLNL